MIAADSSSLIAYLQGEKGKDVGIIDQTLLDHTLFLPPIVLTEILSDPGLPKNLIKNISSLSILEITEGYFQRAGINRSKLIKHKLKARLADTLIAQSCIDYNIALITRDKDFRHFEKYCGLLIV